MSVFTSIRQCEQLVEMNTVYLQECNGLVNKAVHIVQLCAHLLGEKPSPTNNPALIGHERVGRILERDDSWPALVRQATTIESVSPRTKGGC